MQKILVVSTMSLVACSFISIPWQNNSTLASTTNLLNPKCNIKGNISVNTGKKIYHVPGQEDYERTVISLEKGERWFCSEQEAIKAGWTKAPR